LSRKVTALLVAAGESEAGGPNAYDVMYRFPSSFGPHANLHSLLLHIDFDDNWKIILKPSWEFVLQDGVLPTLNTALLARRVFKEFGITSDELDELSNDLFEGWGVKSQLSES
jgi:hypothetical protein